MPTSLSKLIDNLSEGFHNDRSIDCKSCLDHMTTKDEKLIFSYFSFLVFTNALQLCNRDLNKFILLLKKGVYPYQYMDNWERFNDILLPNKETFYSNLNMEDITDTDYRHANKVFKEFKLKNLGEYHDLYVQSDTLLLADVFENFRSIYIKVYELDPAHFLTAPGLV